MNWILKTVIACVMAVGIQAAGAAEKRFTLVIDAGHGGRDAGALGNYSKEKTINLNVALAFGKLVEQNCPDVKVVYTRKSDVFVPLHERANIANKNKANLFVSIHTNALPKGKRSRGLETYTLGMHRAGDNFDVAKRENSVILIENDYKQHYEGFDPRSSESYIMFEFLQDKNMAQSVELARLVQKNTCSTAQRTDKGVKQAGFLVLRETSMPSCLIELGFITTPDEEDYLNSTKGVQALGKGIYQAFVAYKRKYAKGFTIPYKPGADEADGQMEKDAEKDAKSDRVSEESSDKPSGKSSDKPSDKSSDKPSDKSSDKPSGKLMSSAEPQKESPQEKPAVTDDGEEPVFKVQILASGKALRSDNAQFKGVKDIDSYEEGGMYKYTVGSSVNYNEIYQLRKQLLGKFPQAFIIAFKNGSKTNVNEAIREYKLNKTRRQMGK